MFYIISGEKKEIRKLLSWEEKPGDILKKRGLEEGRGGNEHNVKKGKVRKGMEKN